MKPSALVEQFTASLPYQLDDFQVEAIRALANHHSVLVAAPTGTGKALASDTKVLTPTQWKPIAELRPGDQVIGSDGQPTDVLGVYPQGVRPGYRVFFSDGASVVCDVDHLWAVNTKWRRHAGLPWRVLTLREIVAEGLTDGQGSRHFIPIARPAALQPQPVEENGRRVRFTTADPELLSNVQALIPAGVTLIPSGNRPYDWQVVSKHRRCRNDVVENLRELGLMGHLAQGKFVPEGYKFAPAHERLALLQGLMDTDGSVDERGIVELTTVSPKLARDTAFLCGRASIREKPTSGQRAYRLFISLPEEVMPFRLRRKAERLAGRQRRRPSRAMVRVEPVGDVDMTCIAVAATDGLFVVNDFIVTHNTVIGEFGIFTSRKANARAIYTTPIKALSNQKFRDFRARWGDAEVGLLTGDVVVNREAPILVMTTEVLRNMLVTGASVDDVGAIVFDEVHYMGDAERGTAWEEAILLAPRHVPLVCLSATVPNAAEIAEWIRDAHGELTCVFHDQRAVPLEHRYWLPDADPEEHGFKVFTVVDADANLTNDARKLRNVGGELAGRVRWGGVSSQGVRGEERAPGSDKDPREAPAPWRVVRYLESQELTPAIYFVFSRRATEEAASSCVALKPVPHAAELVREAKSRLGDLSPADRNLRQVAMLLGRFLPRGVAVHHAGLLPQVKLLVEELFQAGKLRTVFATDTLALGINMPARTVIVGEMLKFDGQSRRLLTPNEYRQMTGRAGRRGIDERGVSLLMYSPWVTFSQTMRVLTSDLLPLESAFRPTYSTAMNLWLRPEDEERLADLYARSLRRFQHDRTLKELTERKQALEDAFEEARTSGLPVPRHEITERTQELSQIDYELRRARRVATVEARRTVEGLARVLERYDYLRDGRPTDKAPYLRSLFDTNALTLSELLTNQQLEGLDPPEIAEALSWFATDRESPVRGLPLTRRLHRLREIIDVLHGGVLREEERHELQMSRPLPVDFHGVALAWAEGHELASIGQRARMQEGDLVGALQKTLDLIGQLRGAALQGPLGARLVPLLDEADALLRRGVVSGSYEWAIRGLPEPDEDESDDWEIRLLPEDESGQGLTRLGDRRPRRRVPPFVQRRNRGLDVKGDKTVRAGPRSAIKGRKRRS